MEMAYLGLFEKIFNWVLDKIFEPIFKWLSGLLNTVFTWIFNEILAPVLLPILTEVMNAAFDLWMSIFSNVIYGMFAGILKLVDYMETAFDIFIGIKDVTYTPPVGSSITKSLLNVLLTQDTISTVFWMLTAGGLAVALLLTIYATAQSTFDLDFENKRPVSKVLSTLFKTVLQLFLVQFFVYFMLELSAEILKLIDRELTQNVSTSLGRIVFVIASLDAAKDSSYNVTTNPSGNLGPTDSLRKSYYSLQGGKDYSDIATVSSQFDLAEFDYLIGFIAAIFLLFIMAICLITFVQRIFEIILLYLVSPYFVSMMPLDDGERFGRWRDLFIGKCFTGFGSVIGMRLYLLVCPMIMGNQIIFGYTSSAEADYLIKLFFLLGGAWAVYKSGPLVTSLISAGAGQSEAATLSAAGGSLYNHTAGKMVTAGKKAVKSAFRGRPGERSSGTSADSMPPADSTPPFIGPDGFGTAQSIESFSGGPQRFNGTRTPAGESKFSESTASSSPSWKQASIPTGERKGSVVMGNNRKVAKPVAKAVPMAAVPTETATAAETPKKQKTSDFRLGSLLQSTYDGNGNHKIRVLGMGITRNNNTGKVTSVKLPGTKLKRTGDGGPMKVTKFHLPGVVNVKGNVADGKLTYSDISVMNFKYHKDEDGSSSYRLGSHLGVNRAADGSVSHVDAMGVHVHNTEEGAGVRVGKFSVSSEATGTKVNLGQGIGFEKRHGSKKLNSLHIGALNYNRDGSITKNGKS